ncbi:MAG: YitT family protein [Erysipelotrichaceae bacterium]
MRLKAIDDITDYILVIFGALLFALACNLFIIPLDLYNGGLIGIAQLIRAFIIHVGPVSFSSGIDITGIINFLLNVPLLILAYKNISRKFFTKTVVNVIFQTIFLTLIPIPAVPILTDLLAACLIGGIIAGIGVGLTLRSGGSSGGVDILGVYFTMKYADFSVGKLAVGVNLLVYFICAFAFQLPIAIYSIIYSFCMSLVVDKIHYQNINMTAMIFTKRTGVDKSIMKTLSRGVTYWKGSGAYTDEDTYILVTVVSKYEGMSVSGNFEKRLST